MTGRGTHRLDWLFAHGRPADLSVVSVPRDLKVAVLAPHPDDFDAIAVTMGLLRDNGNQIHLAVVTSGWSGVEDSFASPPTPERKAQIRREEQRASCKMFGLPDDRLEFLPLAEDDKAHQLDNPANQEIFDDYLRRIAPDLVFLPHGHDPNLAHHRTYVMMHRYALLSGRIAAAFLNRDPKTIEMRIDAFTPFNEDAARWKARLLRLHLSQHQRNLNTRGHGFDHRILNVNRLEAQELPGCLPYAEAFEVEQFG